jgi:hypothetical protein
MKPFILRLFVFFLAFVGGLVWAIAFFLLVALAVLICS